MTIYVVVVYLSSTLLCIFFKLTQVQRHLEYEWLSEESLAMCPRWFIIVLLLLLFSWMENNFQETVKQRKTVAFYSFYSVFLPLNTPRRTILPDFLNIIPSFLSSLKQICLLTIWMFLITKLLKQLQKVWNFLCVTFISNRVLIYVVI